MATLDHNMVAQAQTLREMAPRAQVEHRTAVQQQQTVLEVVCRVVGADKAEAEEIVDKRSSL